VLDLFVVVDWSAGSRPKSGRDSVWVCWGAVTSAAHVDNVRTREEAVTLLGGLLREAVAAEKRVLVGFDFPYAGPRGLAGALGLEGPAPAWRRLWAELDARIEDDERNRNNRFAAADGLNRRLAGSRPGPFWGRPAGRTELTSLPARKRGVVGFPFPTDAGARLREFRAVEERLQRSGLRPFSFWQLLGAGAVGSQALLGIPRLLHLHDDPDLAPHSVVWPFETDFSRNLPERRPLVVHAEVWPRIFAEEERPRRGEVPDATQVRTLVEVLARQARTGGLTRLLAGPDDLNGERRRAVVEEEGWVLGVGGADHERTSATA
jgi:precorrin-8X/cobalt-precorrin-8 methylmutase